MEVGEYEEGKEEGGVGGLSLGSQVSSSEVDYLQCTNFLSPNDMDYVIFSVVIPIHALGNVREIEGLLTGL